MTASRTHVVLTVSTLQQGDQLTYRLTSPTGRVLVITNGALAATLYGAASLIGRGGRVVLPLATVEALSRLGSVEEPPATSPREETP